MAHRLNHQSGFTLIELLITCVLISIIALVISAFLTSWLGAYSLDDAQTTLLDDAENALDTANTDIRLSGSAEDNNRWPDVNSPSGSYGWQSNGTTLVLAEAAQDKSGNIIFSDPNKYITEKDDVVYFVKNATLYRRTIASNDPNDAAITTCPPPGSIGCPPDRVVATDVANFSVQYYDANEDQVTPTDARSIQLTLQLKTTASSTPLTANYSTRMVFRNE